MPLPPLASQADVEATLGRPLTTLEATYITRLLELASGIVRRYTRQTITAVTGDVVTLPGNWGQTLTLPERPVTAVTSVTINGSATTRYTLIGDDLFLGSGSFMPDYGASLSGSDYLFGPAGSSSGPPATGPNWQGPQSQIVITYDHGYADVPDDIINEVAGMLAIQYESPIGIRMEKIGGYEVGYERQSSGGLTLTDDAKNVLNFYRKRSTTVSLATRR